MLYKQINSSDALSALVRYFWIAEDSHPEIRRQVIVPDGYPEIIFHYGDPYRINISGKWELQGRRLLAGQIRNHFVLENTGVSGMLGIKFNPAGIAQLFGLNMETLTDAVVDLDSGLGTEFESISADLLSRSSCTVKIERLNRLLEEFQETRFVPNTTVTRALDLIFESNGAVPVSGLTRATGVNERTLERMFKRSVGLSPKFYSRIIRFNHIFGLVQKRRMRWAELAQIGGYYDQPHFIRNFREFTGVEPSKYFFEDETLANFFLNRPSGK